MYGKGRSATFWSRICAAIWQVCRSSRANPDGNRRHWIAGLWQLGKLTRISDLLWSKWVGLSTNSLTCCRREERAFRGDLQRARLESRTARLLFDEKKSQRLATRKFRMMLLAA